VIQHKAAVVSSSLRAPIPSSPESGGLRRLSPDLP
jgi:hypothetical protein